MFLIFLIPLIAAIILVGLYVFATDASVLPKVILAILLIVPLVCRFRFPQLWVVALLLQVGLSVFVLLYLKVVSEGL